MPNTEIQEVSRLAIGLENFDIKDLTARTIINEIINAIGANNNNIAERINNLHDRSFDAEIKISSVNETEISNIIDGLYKVQYVTITGEGTEATETLNNSAILIQQGTNQYLIKDGQISNRTKTNNEWSSWESNNVKPDWEAVAGSAAEILNKPDLSNFLTIETQSDWNVTATTSAAFIKNKPTIPAAQIQADWNQTATTSLDYIKNKPTGENILDLINYFIESGECNNNTSSSSTPAPYLGYPTYDSDGTGIVFSENFLDIQSSENIVLHIGLNEGIEIYDNVNTHLQFNNEDIAFLSEIPTVSATVIQNDPNPVSGSAVYGKFEYLIGGAPAALDTLQEIASALNNDADLAGTLTTQISTKVPKVSSPTVDNFASFNSDGTIKDSGVSASSFITSIKTVNNESLVGTGNIVISGLPQVSASDNGKILMVVNGQWQLVSPSVLYTGQGVPNNAQGNNGDLYMQTD